MKVIVLAAGRSKRMQPVKDKNFLNFLGKSLIRHQVESIYKAGLKEIIVVGGSHNLDLLRAEVVKVDKNIVVVEQMDLDMGMCGAVLAAKELVAGGPVLVFSSNDFVDQKAFELIKKASKDEQFESYLLAKKVQEYFPGGYLEVTVDEQIKGIVEKPLPGKEPSDLVNLVVHYHRNSGNLIGYLEKAHSEKDDLYEVALAQMIKDGVKMKAISYEGFWCPVKFPWHVHEVFKRFVDIGVKKIAKSAVIAESAVLHGDIIIGENVKVFDNAVINGPAYIGDNSVIATNTLVRESHIGANCVIGFSTEVARSFLGNNVWTHSNYIGDSVIGNNVSFGGGTVIGNLRLDEANIMVEVNGDKIDSKTNKLGIITGDNVRVGINTSFMPGVKIGANCLIGAGIIVAEDIAENSFVRGVSELKISKNKINIESIDREKFKNKFND